MLGDYADLYYKEYPYPPGRPIPTHVTPFSIDDETPPKGEIEEAVRRMQRNIVDSHTQLWEEHLQAWLREKYL